jgi:hypothetical protein
MSRMGWFAEYKKSVKMIEVEEVFDLIFYRPLAFLFVKLIYRTSLSPNQISFIALGFGVLGGIAYGFATPQALLAAGVLLIIYDVLDCSDGQLARLKKTGTLTGRIIDGFSDWVVAVAIYLGIGFGFATDAEAPVLMWLVVVAAGISNAVHSIMLDLYRNRFMDNTLERKNTLGDSLKEFEEAYTALKTQSGSYFDKFILWLYLKYSSLQISFSSETTTRYRPEDYYQKNRRILHLWTYLGPTTELTFLIVCSLLNRIDIYLWGLVIVGNGYAAILYFFQSRINKRLEPAENL